jgi:hypothetical protein
LPSLFYPPFQPTIPNGFIGCFDERSIREVSSYQPCNTNPRCRPSIPKRVFFIPP